MTSDSRDYRDWSTLMPRFRQRTFYRPIQDGDSCPEARPRNTDYFRPIFQRHRFPIVTEITTSTRRCSRGAILDWLRECFLDRPAMFQSISQNLEAHPKLVCPGLKTLSSSGERHQSVRPGVSGLLTASGPSAIGRTVASVVVDPIKRMLRARSNAQVSKKRLERITPFRADSDAATAVVLEHPMRWAEATRPHRCPDAIFERSGHAVFGRSS